MEAVWEKAGRNTEVDLAMSVVDTAVACLFNLLKINLEGKRSDVNGFMVHLEEYERYILGEL
jgi:hypothetical protein